MRTPPCTIEVRIVYARPGQVQEQALDLPTGSSARQALEASSVRSWLEDYPYDPPVIGIYGQRCTLDRILSDGDRIEIYRPLVFDPMESRRRRAIHRKSRHGKKEQDGFSSQR